jgi:hypothetical protein
MMPDDRLTSYAKTRQEGGAPATVNQELAILRRGFFEREEFHAVAAHLDADVRPLAEFMYLTGWSALPRSLWPRQRRAYIAGTRIQCPMAQGLRALFLSSRGPGPTGIEAVEPSSRPSPMRGPLLGVLALPIHSELGR